MAAARGHRTAGQAALPRVALVTNIPTPYRNSCYRALASVCDLKVFFSAMTEPNRGWRFAPEELSFPHEVLSSLTIPYRRSRPELGMRETVYAQATIGLPRALARFRPEIVVGGGFGPPSLIAGAYARVSGTRWILWSEGTLHTEQNLHPLRIRLRRYQTRWADGFWSNGAQSTALLDAYGRTAAQPVHEGMTGADTQLYRQRTKASLARRDELRAGLGVDGTVFLFVGAVSELKGIVPLAAALRRALTQLTARASLLVAGIGPLAPWLTEQLAGIPALRHVPLGFVEPDRLPELLAAADVFLLPTLADNWSLAVLEAAVAGLPQLFSPHNGGSSDLIAMGSPGTLVDPLQTDRFAEAIVRCTTSPPPRADASVIERVADYYSPERFAERAAASFAGPLRRRERAGTVPSA